MDKCIFFFCIYKKPKRKDKTKKLNEDSYAFKFQTSHQIGACETP